MPRLGHPPGARGCRWCGDEEVVALPVALRSDYDAARLRAAARQSHDAGQTRRLLALAAIYDRATRTEAAAIGGVMLQIVRDWVLKLNERGPDGLVGGKAPDPRSLLEGSHHSPDDGGRGWPDPSGAWRGALASDRPVLVGA